MRASCSEYRSVVWVISRCWKKRRTAGRVVYSVHSNTLFPGVWAFQGGAESMFAGTLFSSILGLLRSREGLATCSPRMKAFRERDMDVELVCAR